MGICETRAFWGYHCFGPVIAGVRELSCCRVWFGNAWETKLQQMCFKVAARIRNVKQQRHSGIRDVFGFTVLLRSRRRSTKDQLRTTNCQLCAGYYSNHPCLVLHKYRYCCYCCFCSFCSCCCCCSCYYSYSYSYYYYYNYYH